MGLSLPIDADPLIYTAAHPLAPRPDCQRTGRWWCPARSEKPPWRRAAAAPSWTPSARRAARRHPPSPKLHWLPLCSRKEQINSDKSGLFLPGADTAAAHHLDEPVLCRVSCRSTQGTNWRMTIRNLESHDGEPWHTVRRKPTSDPQPQLCRTSVVTYASDSSFTQSTHI